MKKVLVAILTLLAVTTFTFASPALAGDAAKGAQVFAANCAACHAGGNNVVMAQKTLKKDALEKYLAGYSDGAVAAITYQVTNGKGAMPAFGGRLSAAQIDDVATYVADQAEKGW